MRLPRLAGPRLLLVPVPHAVAQAAVAGESVAAVLAPLGLEPGPGWPHEGTADALRPYAEHGAAGSDEPVWLVVDGTKVVGDVGLTGRVDEQGDQEIGYGVAGAARRRGLGTEAVALLCAWAEQQPGVHRVVAQVLVGNQASQRLLGRLGFSPEPALPPYERWVRGPAMPSPVARGPAMPRAAVPRAAVRAVAGRIAGKHVC